MLVCCLGDLVLDVIVRLDAPLAPGDDTTARTVLRPGGQAANVAAWAAALGADARFVGRLGADAAGKLVREELTARGVEAVGAEVGRTGVVVSLVGVDGARTMASDRAEDLDSIDPAWLAGADAVHVSGYALTDAAADVRALPGELERVSLDLSAVSLIDDAFRARAHRLAPDVVFATEHEREAFGELDASWVVKHGGAGIEIDGRPYAAMPAEVVDTTGAGDALAAGFLVGGPELGLQAAARCVASVGSMP
jgi:sugar/nucleoside kinase (ribokinase family)